MGASTGTVVLVPLFLHQSFLGQCLMATKNIQDTTVTSDADLETTRDRILDLAEDMFAESGIDKVSLRAVTAAAGVNVSAIHYHFGSKDELLRAIFIRRLS